MLHILPRDRMSQFAMEYGTLPLLNDLSIFKYICQGVIPKIELGQPLSFTLGLWYISNIRHIL